MKKLVRFVMKVAWLALCGAVIACGARSPAHSTTVEDYKVYQAILSDQVTRNSKVFSIMPAPPPPPGAEIVTESAAQATVPAIRLSGLTSPLTDFGELSTRWRSLSAGDFRPCQSSSAISDLKRRNATPVMITGLRLDGTRIVWSRAPEHPAVLVFSLTVPGYSWSRDVALVEVFAGGVGQLVCLRKFEGTWRPVATVHTMST